MKSEENYIKAEQKLKEQNKKEIGDNKNNELGSFKGLTENDI